MNGVCLRVLLPLCVAALAAGCVSTIAARRDGYVFRDCSDCPELVVLMPQQRVPGLPDAIAVGRFEVTRNEFAAFEEEESSSSPQCIFGFAMKDTDQNRTRQQPGLGGYRPSGRDPAICVSWIEAQAYVEWLSKKTGEKYRLPSERELQFFERGSVPTRYAWGDRESDACLYANGLDRTAASQEWATNPRPDLQEYLLTKGGVLDCDDGAAYTAPVGSYKPNALGLYDTTGNVWEWTADCITDEQQWPEGNYYPPCFARGGSWQSSPSELSEQGQLKLAASEHREHVGLRVIRLLSN
jgi:formylglycine-generating enzyme required for sulfatase activity